VTTTPYSTLPGLTSVYLEDSYVLGLEELADTVRLELDVVLLPAHPLYRPPGPGDQYCMRRGTLLFPGARAVRLTRSGAPPAADATGELDYGNIDGFEKLADRTYRLFGEWGHLELESDPPLLRFTDERPH